ncbi:hypothetical protein HCN51_27440 [Nonomuraea sp. FMUSA5-5]|uniref:Uncharacterized protein n=1 Tax=Nonomuraea composti TaxID=2720023 RepID=A0ABX1BBI9_9ACTN|nr:hypothetical protein [Nonomuraea sp. FMUSA5-5]NJP93136.1 hypothetical protein [Nonomuraea sp. FMUSA5-5]
MTGLTAAQLQERAASLTVGNDGEAWILGRPDLGIFVAVPEPGALFVTTWQQTGSAADATSRASQATGEPVNGEEFIDGLAAADRFLALLVLLQVTRLI